jgi:hypothetical protein
MSLEYFRSYFGKFCLFGIVSLACVYCSTTDENFQISHGANFINYAKRSAIDNDITGTGDKLKDIVYITACMAIECPNHCCQGSISIMTCGTEEICDSFRRLTKNDRNIWLILAISLIYMFIPIGWVVVKCLENRQNSAANILSKIFTFYMGILLPPYGIVIFLERIYCPNKHEYNPEIISENQAKKTERARLFHCKMFQVEDFQNGVAKNYHNMECNTPTNKCEEVNTEVNLDFELV